MVTKFGLRPLIWLGMPMRLDAVSLTSSVRKISDHLDHWLGGIGIPTTRSYGCVPRHETVGAEGEKGLGGCCRAEGDEKTTTIPDRLSGGQTGKVVEELCELLQDLVIHVHEAIS